MDETNSQPKMGRPSPLRTGGGLKSTLSGKSSPRNSSSFRRSHSNRTPRRDGRNNVGRFRWILGNRVVFWLILITLWAYIGFHFQSQWAHNNNEEAEFLGHRSDAGSITNNTQRLYMKGNASDSADSSGSKGTSILKRLSVSLKRKAKRALPRKNSSSKRTRRTTTVPARQNDTVDEEIPRRNTSYGLIVGPFGKTEDNILGWNAEKRRGTCDRKGGFARIVWSRSFVLVLHELSMTGSPLSMMELATEILSCGGSVSAVVLSRKGGLMGELDRRGIKVLKDKAEFSFKTAMKADLVIAGSAVCASWIDQYLSRFAAGSSKIVWWIMENRREYFDRSKNMLSQVKMLIFLSDLQSKQWLAWCAEENIHLNSEPAIVPLSVNDELAFVAGIPCSLNTPSFSVENMLERRSSLRVAVRKEMGLTDDDMLVMSLSSINPGKGQLLLLESARLMVERGLHLNDSSSDNLMEEENQSGVSARKLLQKGTSDDISANESQRVKVSKVASNKRKRKHSRPSKTLSAPDGDGSVIKRALSQNENTKPQNLKILIGSIGSKSNKIPYVKGILRFLSQHSTLSKLVLWTPATTRVAALYAAADVYVINAQGLGETFGRVTIEAMAFGLPVLGTEAGGTGEIVVNNVTGLLHPVGRPGTHTLAKNIDFFLNNRKTREQMGMSGRVKVVSKYLKNHMYQKLAEVLIKCMKIK
ncbi:hypothetical protein QJS10_CPA07g00509 [Acorus calamus]|uniref:Glycosyl transferase family 1 domain-containing protein n=1 Tax=Acorus calamus TaxID=4465 RepID=A0AAV9EG84_ACOCL|nr:hypothetical protein QJS10_CPA07g00509 [Acorus calamus]